MMIAYANLLLNSRLNIKELNTIEISAVYRLHKLPETANLQTFLDNNNKY